MNILIIEDEAAACDNIINILKRLNPNIQIVGCLDTVASSVSWLKSNPLPDLIFMDIQLADGISFTIFECINLDAPIIFTTAYDEFAIKAFEVNSIDYILKPISIEKVEKALMKFKKLTHSNLQQSYLELQKTFRPKEYLNRILIPINDKIIPVKTEQIAYFYSTNNINKIITTDNKEYSTEKSLDYFIENLDPTIFFRANRQFILSKEIIESITIWFDSRLLINLSIETPERVYVSKNKASIFKKWFAST